MLDSFFDRKKLETFLQINYLINSNYDDPKYLLRIILDSATTLTESEASSLLLLDSTKGVLRFQVALGTKGSELENLVIPIGQGIAGWVAENNCSLIVDDVSGDKRFFDGIAKSLSFTTKSILAVPLRVKDKCIGVLEMINKKNGEYFNSQDQEWLDIFANQAAIAIQNANQFSEINQEVLSLRNTLKSENQKESLKLSSQEMLQVFNLAQKYAEVDSSVLLEGETGVGKEVVADFIHKNGSRKNKPFIKLNCAALPENLLESELFGYKKGAFTDAVQDKIGKIEAANGGTLFLDEIGELPLSLQPKLLRTLQTKTIQPLGSNESISCDIKIISATNGNLKNLVQNGTFRQDLLYRLNVLPITIPPLRARKEDIIPLAEYFLRRFANNSKNQSIAFSEETMLSLKAHNWPGNVRELENAIERAVVLSDGSTIKPTDLGLQGFEPIKSDFQIEPLKDAINSFKSHYIRKVLALNSENQTKTAQILGIQRTYLSKLIKEINEGIEGDA